MIYHKVSRNLYLLPCIKTWSPVSPKCQGNFQIYVWPMIANETMIIFSNSSPGERFNKFVFLSDVLLVSLLSDEVKSLNKISAATITFPS